MIGMLITLIIAVLLLGLLWWAINLLPIPEPVRTIAVIIVALIVLLLLLRHFAVL